jgi:NAD(P)H dehydrogenase (quinone)
MSTWAEDAAKKNGAETRRRIFPEIAPQEAIENNDAWKEFREDKGKSETVVSLDDLEWADVLIFSFPTRYGNMPSQVQAFLDTTGGLWASGKLINKIVTGFSSAMNPHGGQEGTVQALYKTAAHWGAIIIPAGYSDDAIFAAGGNPYGTSATIDQKGNIDNEDKIKAAVEHQVKRTIEIARKIVE